MMNIQERLSSFKDDLSKTTVPIIVRKHITYGDCFALDQATYFYLKDRIASKFELHPSQILMVGSGKLGFSIVRKKRYRPFGETSDIDMAIVCPELFDRVWKEVFNYKQSYSYWPEEERFHQYLFRGWIRPDKLPPSSSFEFCQHWWEFFRELTSSLEFGPYQIRAGLYKSWYFLEKYQAQCVEECQGIQEVRNENNSN